MSEKNKKDIEWAGSLASRINPKANKSYDDNLKRSDMDAINVHNRHYSTFLYQYIYNFKKKNKTLLRMKIGFFIIVMFLLFVLIVSSCVCIIIVSTKKADVYDITILITSLASAITSFIILPKIMAKHLFPYKEEDTSNMIFSKMIEYDLQLRTFHKSNIPNDNK